MTTEKRTDKSYAHRTRIGESATRAITEFLAHSQSKEIEAVALIYLAGETISRLIWMVGEEMEPDDLFRRCKEVALENVKHRVDFWHARMTAAAGPSQAAP